MKTKTICLRAASFVIGGDCLGLTTIAAVAEVVCSSMFTTVADWSLLTSVCPDNPSKKNWDLKKVGDI